MTARPTLDPDVMARLRLAIARINRQLVQASSSRDLTFAQLSAMARLDQHGPLRLGELAGRERVSAPSLIRTIAPLCERGLIARHPDPADRRSQLLLLTDQGREVIDRVRRERSELLAARVAGLTGEQAATLSAAVPVLELLAEEPPPPPARG